MSTYICEKCGCIDNTACGGNYWLVKAKLNLFKDEYSNTHCLCVECTPTEFSDGSKNKDAGKWHNRFPKKHWSDLGKEHILKMSSKQNGNYVNAEEYFNNLKVKGKNLIDLNKQIVNFAAENNETIINTEMNEFTLNYLKSCGFISIADKPTIINNNLLDFQIIINREKNSIPTEYVKYDIYKKKGENSNDNSTSNKN